MLKKFTPKQKYNRRSIVGQLEEAMALHNERIKKTIGNKRVKKLQKRFL